MANVGIGYYLFVIILSIFWTYFAMLRIAIEIFKSPFGFFKLKRRSVTPDVLTKGWKHGFIQISQVKIHYVEPEWSSTNKPLMLFLHGFPEFWYTWRHQLPAFKHDYRTIAVDMRGYGQSDKPSGIHNYTFNKLTKDVKEIVAALGYQSCVLVAHDWGGAVAWQTTLLYPEIVDKLIMFNCPHPSAFAKYLRAGSWRQMLKSWYMFFFQCPYLPEMFIRSNDLKIINDMFTNPKLGGCRNPNAFTDEDIEGWKYTFSQPGAITPPLNYYRASMRRIGIPETFEKSTQVQPPTLIVWGTADLALEKGMAALSAKYCRQATLHYIEGASHWVQQDEPELCTKYMREFLQA